jgi:hypothetical protein
MNRHGVAISRLSRARDVFASKETLVAAGPVLVFLIAVLTVLRPPAWLTAILTAGASAVVAVLSAILQHRGSTADERRRLKAEDESRARRYRRALDLWPVREVSAVTPDVLRVALSPIAERYRRPGESRPPYVTRDHDGLVREALRTRRFILLHGASAAGKSRTAFEAAVRVMPHAWLIVPSDQAGLATLLERGLPVDAEETEVLIWLDDLERFLVAGGREVLQGLDAWTTGASGQLSSRRSRPRPTSVSPTAIEARSCRGS